VFGSNYYIKDNEDDLGKFKSRIDEGIFLGYSSTKKAYRCYNKRLHKIVESVDVKVDDIKPRKEKNLDSIENTCDDEIKDLQKDESIHNEEEDKEKEDTQEDDEDFPRSNTKNPFIRVQKDHPKSHIMGDKNVGVKTRRQLPDVEQALLSIVEPNNFTEASKSDEWVKAMNEELDQIEKNETWELVPRPEDKKM